MARISLGAAILCSTFLLLSISAGTQLPPSEVYRIVIGRWQVEDVMCPTCSSQSRPEVGSTLELGDAKLKNPFGGDCDNAPGYNLLRKTSTSSLISAKGRAWPEALKRALRAERSVTYGYVTCDGGNHMRMIFADNERAYYFWEGDTVFVLKRIP